jgi:6-pyruvoyltetrahydropterin/6-carboxytetrahydropterin synthase
MTIISKEYSFDAAHILPSHKGKCRNLHGHTYQVRVDIDGPINSETGMVIDFGDVSGVVKPIIQSFDHSFIAGIIRKDNQWTSVDVLLDLCIDEGWKVKRIDYPHTTAENIALTLQTEIIKGLMTCSNGMSVRVVVWETPSSFAQTTWRYYSSNKNDIKVVG